MRIGYSATLGYARVDVDVARLVALAAQEFSTLGANVEEIDLKLDDPINIMQPLRPAAGFTLCLRYNSRWASSLPRS